MGGGRGRSCFSSTVLKLLRLSSWNFLTLKKHLLDTFYRSYQFVIFWGATMATKLRKVPCKIWLNRKVKLLNNSVIFKDVELKFGMETSFGSLNGSMKNGKSALILQWQNRHKLQRDTCPTSRNLLNDCGSRKTFIITICVLLTTSWSEFKKTVRQYS